MKQLNLILAAGQGKRMHSSAPKVLQPLGGRAMIRHLLDTTAQLKNSDTAIIFGHGGAQLQAAISSDYPTIQWICQEKQLGTGDAVRSALDHIAHYDLILILTGDTPLISLQSLERLLAAAEKTGFALLTTICDQPTGYGRIIRGKNDEVVAIVEEKDASEAEKAIIEINTGIMAMSRSILQAHLSALQNDNAQGEYYLTDLIALSHAAGENISAVVTEEVAETIGINNRAQLAQAENIYRKRQAKALLAAGATLIDPNRIDIHGRVTVGRDVIIEPNVFFQGEVILGDNVYIESGSRLENCQLGDSVHIRSHSRLENCTVEAKAQIGPFARLRPKTHLSEGARIGNFVEIKAAKIGKDSKVNHLSYIGDATLGDQVNIGAGTITCNYDGLNKHHTTLGNNVFIGSNTALVAPVKVHDHATIGAGSVINHDIKTGELALTRPPLKTITNWQRPQKREASEVPTGAVKTIGKLGSAYQVGEIIETLPNGDILVEIIMLETGEKLEHRLSDLLRDPDVK